MKLPAIFGKDYLKRLAKKKIENALAIIEENIELADLSERTAFELRVVSRFAKEDMNVKGSVAYNSGNQSQESKQTEARN